MSVITETTVLIEIDVAPTAYLAGHIPGALLWNIYADLRRPDYSPIEAPELEELLVRSGITPETSVVFYGYGAHLGYWLLTSHGHRDVRLLDEPTPIPADADGRVHVSRAEMFELIEQPDVVVLDVRSRAEYDGDRFWPSGATEDAGRPGHIPGSIHLPIDELRSEDGSFRTAGEMSAVVRRRGILRSQRIVTYCTVGNRASQAWYALSRLLGYDAAVYQGGWAEWGKLPGAPIAP